MKYMILKSLLLVFLSVPLFANIDAQIEAIQKAPIEERFKLMNAFKKEIVQMQEQERIKAMTKLKSITKSKYADKVLKELTKHSRREVSKQRSHQREHISHDNEIQNNIENEIEEQVKNETEEHIENETEEQVENETEDHIEEDHDDDD